ncbi:flagellar basal-body MS-ring/collar protein FliF [Pseudaestuariivita rosea]|uniref:flagellar basal-body MS-ring/collar protein FliF n=1 Tax=Pseudaestuariivita rosea TaxID=2763263 RepID=UPI001ABB39BE|nr:flagellar basal-body MS-ring/collar protein FliF [Pseudaestuariivita rosea]
MQQIQAVWRGLDNRRRMVVAIATVAMFVTVLALSRVATNPSMSLLYSGLETSASGEVITALEARSVPYEVRGDAIYVDSAQRDILRMSLASEGLPATGGAGYELLDSLSGFGTTSQMFDAAYWRAKEGELARTIIASPNIKSARVHISSPSAQPFARNINPTASVWVTSSNGTISAAQANALRFLVSSAVAGLAPENVSVIDGQGNLIGAPDEPSAPSGSDLDRAAALKQSVERLLAARVGAGNAIVEVSLETVTDRESIVERRFDPESRVAISTDTEERTNTASGQSGGTVTVASNLPDGEANAQQGSNSSQNSETRERINYEVSETQREVLRAPGAIKRLTVAVLVDGIAQTSDTGEQVFQPRPDVELEALRELVASAVGFSEARGDVITIKSMAFEPLAELGTTAQQSMLSGFNLNVMTLIQLVVLALVTLLLGLFVVRPILLARPAPAVPELAPPSPAFDTEPPGLPSLDGEIAGDDDMPVMSTPPSFDFPVANDMGSDFEPLPNLNNDPVARLRNLIDERQDETVEILRKWMEDEEEKA